MADPELKKKIIDVVRRKDTQLPTLPVIVDKILEFAQSDRTSATDLANLIENDPAISGKLLKLANSAYYGFMKEVDTISRAITIVGFNEVIGVTIGMNVFSTFGKKDTHGIFKLESLWLHSIACATAARMIAKKKRVGDADKIFLVGLLHDMGKVVFAKYFPTEYAGVFGGDTDTPDALYRKEKATLGIDHAELSGLVMRRWNFPDDLLLPCRYHHSSQQAPSHGQMLASIVELADYLCTKAKMGHGGNGIPNNLSSIKRKLNISSPEIDSIIHELGEHRPNMEEFLSVVSEKR